MPEIEINSRPGISTTLFYLDENPKAEACVVLLHGLGADSSSWGYQIEALRQAGMRCIVPDIPGFGKSVFTGRGWNVALAAQVLADWLRQLALPAVDLVGISMGGAVALQLVLDAPERIHRLVCVNTFGCLRPKRPNELFYLLMRYVKANLKGVEAQAQMVALRIFPEEEQEPLRQILIEQILQADPTVYRAAMRSLGLFNVRKRLGEIHKTTLVITGENDTTVPLASQAELVHGIEGARQVMIPHSGHAVIADQPVAFNAALLEFLLNTT
ncbi:MAG: alpha/beta hydrolase [Chloroflexi bacterium]|nr:alpha/beta hydrolase [Chloroflexota bacterium]